jgi:hypothetical protein
VRRQELSDGLVITAVLLVIVIGVAAVYGVVESFIGLAGGLHNVMQRLP